MDYRFASETERWSSLHDGVYRATMDAFFGKILFSFFSNYFWYFLKNVEFLFF
jgi:hypothetical protein